MLNSVLNQNPPRDISLARSNVTFSSLAAGKVRSWGLDFWHVQLRGALWQCCLGGSTRCPFRTGTMLFQLLSCAELRLLMADISQLSLSLGISIRWRVLHHIRPSPLPEAYYMWLLIYMNGWGTRGFASRQDISESDFSARDPHGIDWVLHCDCNTYSSTLSSAQSYALIPHSYPFNGLYPI